MKFFIAIPFILLALYSCGESEKEDMTIEHEYSIIERFLEEYNLHPTQKENINHITGMITTNNAQYVFGQKNYNGWICKFDMAGNELQSNELPKLDSWSYSYFDEKLYNDDNFALLSCFYTNSKNIDTTNSDMHDISISILDLDNLKETEKIKEIHRPQIYKENGRYVIAFWWSDIDIKKIYIMGDDGIIKYSLDWGDNEEKFFSNYNSLYKFKKNIMMFLTDEIVAPVLSSVSKPTLSNLPDYKIINLKNWEIIKTISLQVRGEHLGENNIVYSVDTTYLNDNSIKYVYRENKIKSDEISGSQEIEILNKYYYNINTKTYEALYMGKLE